MENQELAGEVITLLDQLALGLADPHGDLDVLEDIEEQLIAAQQAALVPRLKAYLDAAAESGNWYARSVLANVLASTDGRSSLAVLLRAHSRDLGDDQDRLATRLYVFAQEDPAAARRVLLPWAEDSDQELRRAAIRLLGYVPEAADLTLLAKEAQDRDERVRTAAVGTLGSHHAKPEAVSLLVSLLSDPSPQVRVSVLSSLGFLQQSSALPAICRLADDSSSRVRAWVAIALGRFQAAQSGSPATAAALDRLQADPDPMSAKERQLPARVPDLAADHHTPKQSCCPRPPTGHRKASPAIFKALSAVP
ncbi:HEAT repeat domain-containing protein [Streptomyces sp. NPDC101234]|uniref:HEAT repeat domain-containing protein n=1 Tax=Streptomyces sp. NPDC101234 TaxID=3366138 RepID=UPI00381DBBF0